jgi:hypothetical protein
MNMDDLIASLADDLTPVRPGLAQRSVTLAAAAGALAALLLMLVAIGGLRSDMMDAMAGVMFWTKIGYTASLALVALGAVIVMTRPEADLPRWLWLAALPFALLAIAAGIELTYAPAEHRMGMWLGQTWHQCPVNVLAMAVPVFIGLTFAFRRFAPTRLRATGAVIGLASGAAAATVYCLHCTESTAIFVLSWYTLGIVVAAAIGALLGPRLLRW